MKVYIPTMSASDETHRITSYLTDNAYRLQKDAIKVLEEVAETYDRSDGYIRTMTTPTSIQYRVKSQPTDYTLELRIDIFEVI